MDHVITRVVHWTNRATSALLLAVRLAETGAELGPLGDVWDMLINLDILRLDAIEVSCSLE